MKVQTRGEFEEECHQETIYDCFAFIHYKGRWIRSVVKHSALSIHKKAVYGYYSFPAMDVCYLSECIIKVYKPEPPEDA